MSASHPTDEQLSALLDDDVEAGVDAHIDACDSCRARLAALRRAADAVAAPVTPRNALDRERDIAFAIAAAAERPVEPVRPPTAIGPPAHRRRPPAWLLPAAAAIVALVLAVPLIASMGSGGSSKKSASVTTAVTAGAETAAPKAPLESNGSAGDVARSATAAGGGAIDLGDVNNVTDLQHRVSSQLQSLSAPVAGPSSASGANAKKSTATRASGCEAPAEAAGGTQRPLVYQATLRWQGRPAMAFGFRQGAGPLTVVVVAADSCAVLTTTSV
jgi:hypothetical protein